MPDAWEKWPCLSLVSIASAQFSNELNFNFVVSGNFCFLNKPCNIHDSQFYATSPTLCAKYLISILLNDDFILTCLHFYYISTFTIS